MGRQGALRALAYPLVAGAGAQPAAPNSAAVAEEPGDVQRGHGGALGGAPGRKAKNRSKLGLVRFRRSFDLYWLRGRATTPRDEFSSS